MSYRNSLLTKSSSTKIKSILLISSILTTICLFGFLSLLMGPQDGFLSRMPLYVFGTSISFVVAIILYDGLLKTGQSSIRSAFLMGFITFIFLVSFGEGIISILVNSNLTLTTKNLFYLPSLSLFLTGIGYWMSLHKSDLISKK
ncbi:hypothetical protein [Candidatus Hikarchaeum yamanae]|uniref:hypothetical protein n=1 Tax=Candidatus Hikarchaeum yamanae TaxID=2675326 RepID=UPI0039EAF6AA